MHRFIFDLLTDNLIDASIGKNNFDDKGAIAVLAVAPFCGQGRPFLIGEGALFSWDSKDPLQSERILDHGSFERSRL
jgi:hypothetical protein